jgi:hypothetical protein
VQVDNFGEAFDPDDLEGMAFIYDEAQEWLESRGNEITRFPSLEESYEQERTDADEWEKDHPEEDD